jgi:hypothetical protein
VVAALVSTPEGGLPSALVSASPPEPVVVRNVPSDELVMVPVSGSGSAPPPDGVVVLVPGSMMMTVV